MTPDGTVQPPTPPAAARLEIDLGAIVANWRLLCQHHPSGPVAGVVKADAYGLGAPHVAPALHAAGCRHFFVALPDEALAIRDRLPAAMLAVLGGLLPGAEQDYAAHDLTPVLNSLAELDAWAATARRLGRAPPCPAAHRHRNVPARARQRTNSRPCRPTTAGWPASTCATS